MTFPDFILSTMAAIGSCSKVNFNYEQNMNMYAHIIMFIECTKQNALHVPSIFSSFCYKRPNITIKCRPEVHIQLTGVTFFKTTLPALILSKAWDIGSLSSNEGNTYMETNNYRGNLMKIAPTFLAFLPAHLLQPVFSMT